MTPRSRCAPNRSASGPKPKLVPNNADPSDDAAHAGYSPMAIAAQPRARRSRRLGGGMFVLVAAQFYRWVRSRFTASCIAGTSADSSCAQSAALSDHFGNVVVLRRAWVRHRHRGHGPAVRAMCATLKRWEVMSAVNDGRPRGVSRLAQMRNHVVDCDHSIRDIAKVDQRTAVTVPIGQLRASNSVTHDDHFEAALKELARM